MWRYHPFAAAKMEALYLLFSIISTSVTSLALALLLFFRTLLARLVPSRTSYSSANAEPVALYQGTVYHERRRPVHHSFRYSVRYPLIDLDNASADQVPPDHLSADEARNFSGTSGQVTGDAETGIQVINKLCSWYLNPRLCINRLGSDICLLYYVTNTPWGERVKFVLDPQSDLVAKPLHVSPFMALKLWWKNVCFIQHPRYCIPAYKQEAIARDQKLQCCPAFELTNDNHQVEGSNSVSVAHGINRMFVWRDAKWPWS